MKTHQVIRVCGTITKKESIVPLWAHTLQGTVVAEANAPYEGYYGFFPKEAKPNSIFLFTKYHYLLEDVLHFAQRSDSCLIKPMNVGTGTMHFSQSSHPFIRLKYFQEYRKLASIQKCFMEQGVAFEKNISLEPEALIRVSKCFELKEISTGIYLDLFEKDKGYIQIDGLLHSNESFADLIRSIRNNSSCSVYDAVRCEIIKDSRVIEMIRIYAEKLSPDQLSCIRATANRIMMVMLP